MSAPKFAGFQHFASLRGQQRVHERGWTCRFFTYPAHECLVAAAGDALEASGAHAVLVGSQYLLLEALAVARPVGSTMKVRSRSRHLARWDPLTAWLFLLMRSLPQTWITIAEIIPNHHGFSSHWQQRVKDYLPYTASRQRGAVA